MQKPLNADLHNLKNPRNPSTPGRSYLESK